jgi:hypothetical protein
MFVSSKSKTLFTVLRQSVYTRLPILKLNHFLLI